MTMLFLAVSSCGIYRAPEEGDYSVVPTTNNPSVTRDKGASGALSIPAVNY